MDAFLTEAEGTLRRAAAGHFKRLADPRAPGAAEPLDEILNRLLTQADDPVVADARGAGLSASVRVAARVSILEAAAARDPRLARRILGCSPAAAGHDPLEGTVLRLGLLAGTADHVLEAGLRAARERGAFASSLMGCREVQESLAGLVAGAELMRLGACRLCRLLDRREEARAEAEAVRLLAGARALAGDVRAVAISLLGPAWVTEHLPEDDPVPADERTTS